MRTPFTEFAPEGARLARRMVVNAVTRQVRARLAALVAGGAVGGAHVQKSTARRSA